ncbi:MAG: hypothetical protein HYW77_01880 [Parcubacteria group bacterium]|nr:hypothetical protein [Parcubacteria group bacterium]
MMTKKEEDFKYQPMLGPEFEPGPGWGKKFSSWFKSVIPKRLFPLIAVLFLVLGLYSFLSVVNIPYNDSQLSYQSAEFISILVQPSDGFIKVARRALDQFLVQNETFADKLGPEQKLFIEQYLYDKNRQVSVIVGQEVKILATDLEEAIASALVLPEHTLARWREYLK